MSAMPVRHIRSRYRAKARSRTGALPAASAFFIATVALAVLYFTVSPWPASDRAPQTSRSASLLADPLRRASGDPDSDLHNGYGDLCSSGGITSKKPALALFIPGIIFCFIGLAIVTDDYFVSALEQICEQLQLSEDVAGATFMAAGSSTPEFFASLLGVFVTKDEVGIGTIVGSAVFNLLVIIGLSAALAGAVLKLDWRPLMRDSIFYIISVLLLLVFTLFSTKSVINWWEGLILVLTYIAYVLFMAFLNKPYMAWTAKWFKEPIDDHPDLEAGKVSVDVDVDVDPAAQPTLQGNPLAVDSRGATISAGGTRRYRDLNPRTRLKVAQYAVIAARRFATTPSSDSADGAEPATQLEPEIPIEHPKTFLGTPLPSGIFGWLFFPLAFPWRLAFRLTILDCSGERRRKLWPVTFITSIIWISGISYIMVEAARVSGCLIGIPAPAMGLTVLAAGTSVPDALASISVARDGAGDMAVSNAIGSNVFDILLGLGLPWFLGALILKDETREGITGAIFIPADPIGRVIIPIIILIAIVVVFVILLILLRWQMSPVLGYSLFFLYFVFITYTLLDVFVWKFST